MLIHEPHFYRKRCSGSEVRIGSNYSLFFPLRHSLELDNLRGILGTERVSSSKTSPVYISQRDLHYCLEHIGAIGRLIPHYSPRLLRNHKLNWQPNPLTIGTASHFRSPVFHLLVFNLTVDLIDELARVGLR